MIFFFIDFQIPLLLYCTTFLFYCSLVFRAPNASYVFYMYCVIHLELQSNLQRTTAFFALYRRNILEETKVLLRNSKYSFPIKYSVIKISQSNVDVS